MPKVSHNGKQLAFLAPLAGALNVWEAPEELQQGSEDVLLTPTAGGTMRP